MDSNFILSSFCIYLIFLLLCVFMAFMETFQIAQFTRHFCNNITKSAQRNNKTCFSGSLRQIIIAHQKPSEQTRRTQSVQLLPEIN